MLFKRFILSQDRPLPDRLGSLIWFTCFSLYILGLSIGSVNSAEILKAYGTFVYWMTFLAIGGLGATAGSLICQVSNLVRDYTRVLEDTADSSLKIAREVIRQAK